MGDSLPLLNSKNFHRLWLFLSPQQTSLAQEFSPSRVTQTLSLSVLGEMTQSWAVLGTSILSLLSPKEERKKICLCDFRWTVLNCWDVLLLKPINNKFMFSCPVSKCRNYLRLCSWSNPLLYLGSTRRNSSGEPSRLYPHPLQ